MPSKKTNQAQPTQFQKNKPSFTMAKNNSSSNYDESMVRKKSIDSSKSLDNKSQKSKHHTKQLKLTEILKNKISKKQTQVKLEPDINKFDNRKNKRRIISYEESAGNSSRQSDSSYQYSGKSVDNQSKLKRNSKNHQLTQNANLKKANEIIKKAKIQAQNHKNHIHLAKNKKPKHNESQLIKKDSVKNQQSKNKIDRTELIPSRTLSKQKVVQPATKTKNIKVTHKLNNIDKQISKKIQTRVPQLNSQSSLNSQKSMSLEKQKQKKLKKLQPTKNTFNNKNELIINHQATNQRQKNKDKTSILFQKCLKIQQQQKSRSVSMKSSYSSKTQTNNMTRMQEKKGNGKKSSKIQQKLIILDQLQQKMNRSKQLLMAQHPTIKHQTVHDSQQHLLAQQQKISQIILEKISSQAKPLIPPYSAQQMRKIQILIKTIKVQDFHHHSPNIPKQQQQQITESIIKLLSWIWQGQSHLSSTSIYLQQLFNKKLQQYLTTKQQEQQILNKLKYGNKQCQKQKNNSIDISKCINRLIDIYRCTNQGTIFNNKFVEVQRDILNRNGLGQEFDVNRAFIKGINSSKINYKDSYNKVNQKPIFTQIGQGQQNPQKQTVILKSEQKPSTNYFNNNKHLINQNSSQNFQQKQQISSLKQYKIFNLYKSYIQQLKRICLINNDIQKQQLSLSHSQVPLIIFLLEIVIYNYDKIGLLYQIDAISMVTNFRKNIKNSIELYQRKIWSNNRSQPSNKIQKFLERFYYEVMESLNVFTFSELAYIKNQQCKMMYTVKNKKENQSILWKYTYFASKIYQAQIKNMNELQQTNHYLIQSAYSLLVEFTGFMKGYRNKPLQEINMIEIEKFFEFLVTKIFQYNVQQQIIKQKINNNQELDVNIQRQFIDKRHDLLLFDWAILKLKSQQYKTFQLLLKKCKKLLFTSLKLPSCNKNPKPKQNHKNKNKFQRYTIQQAQFQQQDELFSSYKKNSDIQEQIQYQTDKNYNHKHNFHNKQDKTKSYVRICHMNFLTFKQLKSKSYKNRQKILKRGKSKIKFNKSPHSLLDMTFCSLNKMELFLLILDNKDYIFKLLQELQYIQTECFSTNQILKNVGNGLVKFFDELHKFKSIHVIKSMMRQIQTYAVFRKLLEEIFNKDIDHQRRLSQSGLHVTKGMNINNQRGNSNNLKIRQNSQQSRQANHPKIPSPTQQKNHPQQHHLQKKKQIIISSCQSIFFQLIKQIQQKIPFLRLSTYLQQIIKKLQNFRCQIFYQKLLSTQWIGQGRIFLSELIKYHIDKKLIPFDMMNYVYTFVKVCLKEENQSQIQKLVSTLPIDKLVKFHLMIFRESFQQTYLGRSKCLIPQSLNRSQQLTILTSCGCQQKTLFIDKLFQIPQLILDRRYLPIISSTIQQPSRYLCIKIIFTSINLQYNPNLKSKQKYPSKKKIDQINWLIQKFEQQINHNTVDEVSNIFHFLSLILFSYHETIQNYFYNKKQSKISNKNSKINKNSKFINNQLDHQVESQNNYQEQYNIFIVQILNIISINSKNIIKMFSDKQSLTLKYLHENMQRTNNTNDNSLNTENQIDMFKKTSVHNSLRKSKSIHNYFIKNIIRFLENIIYTQIILKNIKNPEQMLQNIKQICKCQHLTKQQALQYSLKQYHIPKTIFYLSSVSGNQLFQQTFKRQLKKYEENPKKLFDKYEFLMYLRFIAKQWTIEHMMGKKENVVIEGKQSKQTIKSFPKSSKSSTDQHLIFRQNNVFNNQTKKPSSKTLQNNFNPQQDLTKLIPIQKIIQISLRILRIPLKQIQSLRDSQKLKQKMICLQILSLIHNYIIKQEQKLKLFNMNLLKSYKNKYNAILGHTLVMLVSNEPELLGSQSKQLVMFIRMEALTILISNYPYNVQYNQYEWRFLARRQNFWFLVFSSIFDESLQIRYLLLNYVISRFKNQKMTGFRKCKLQIITFLQLLSAHQPIKLLADQAKQCLLLLKSYPIQINFPTNKVHPFHQTLLDSIIMCIWFIANFNTMYIIQKDQKKLNDTVDYMMIVDMIFDHRDMDAYIFQIVKYFQELQKQNKLDKLFMPLKWYYQFNIKYYIMVTTRVYKQQKKKQIFQLMEQLQSQQQKQKMRNVNSKKVQQQQQKLSLKYNPRSYNTAELLKTYEKIYPHSQNVFRNTLAETLKSFRQQFGLRAVKVKTYLKNRKVIQLDFSRLGLKSGIFNRNCSTFKHQYVNQYIQDDKNLGKKGNKIGSEDFDDDGNENEQIEI